MNNCLQKKCTIPFNKRNIGIVLLAVSATLCVLPFITHQTILVGHDVKFHIFQSAQFYKAITSGKLIPNWALDANNGYGSANFLFYSPLSYYVVALFHFFIPSLIAAIICAIWTSFFLSGITMYLMIKRFTGRTTGLLCAVLYQIFPFHIFDLYLRATLGELFAFIWFPLIFIFLNEILYSENKHTAILGFSLSYAGLVLTHLVSAFIVSGIVIFYILLNYFNISNRKSSTYALASFSLGLGLTSYFILPIIFEMSYVRIDYIHKYFFADYRKNFLLQLNTLYADFLTLNSPNRFIGLLNIASVLELLLFLIVVYILLKKNMDISNIRRLRFSIYMFLLAFFMSTPLSMWLWDSLPLLNTIQFPWRFMAFMEVSLIFLIAIFINEVMNERSFAKTGKFRNTLYVVSTLIIISLFTIFINNYELPQKTINSILYPEKYGYDSGLPREYTPVWAKEIEQILLQKAPERVSVLSGTATTETISWQPESRILKVDARTSTLLRIATFYYPGWIAESNGKKVRIFIEKNSGTMLIDIKPGRHLLTLKFIDTPLRRTAKYLTLLFGLFLFSYIVKVRTRLNNY